jgi:hypothetical protein
LTLSRISVTRSYLDHRGIGVTTVRDLNTPEGRKIAEPAALLTVLD